EPLGLVPAQVRVDGVRVAHEILEHRPRRRATKVERHRLLAAVEGLEEERVRAHLKGRNVPTDVAACRRILDLDHLRAEIRELEGPPRAGAELLEGDDTDVSERQHMPPLRGARSARGAGLARLPG